MTTSAAQRRELARQDYDAYLASCPSRLLLATLADKWVVLVMSALADGSARHSALRRVIAGVSQKMLTQTLRGLERDGLVTRTVVADVPVSVSYALTDLGRSLMDVVVPLKGWAEENIGQVQVARGSYDAARPDPDRLG